MKFLLYFANELLSFRWSEFDGILSKFKLDITVRDRSMKPFVIVDAESGHDVKKLCSRSVLIMSAYELWAEGSTRSCMFSQLKKCPFLEEDRFIGINSSFKILVEAFNKKLTPKQKVDKIEEMDFLPLEGPINLRNPDNTFSLIEFYGLSETDAGPEPEHLFFGRLISASGRKFVHQFNLKERKFISNTSMDPKLSFIMNNIASVGEGDTVLDPFVGSGSLLVAAAKFGAFVVGGDIDYKLLFGLSRPTRPNATCRSPNEDIYNNLLQYGLGSQYLDILLADASLPVFREGFLFDCILCDPPYGVREACKRVGTEKVNFKIPDSMIPLHFPAKVQYHFQDILQDLLDFSSKFLKIGGKVVFWVPVFKDDSGNKIHFCEPSHPCLSFVSSCEQVLTALTSRVLYCLEKHHDPGSDWRTKSRDKRRNLLNGPTFRDNFFKSVKARIESKQEDKQKERRHLISDQSTINV